MVEKIVVRGPPQVVPEIGKDPQFGHLMILDSQEPVCTLQIT